MGTDGIGARLELSVFIRVIRGSNFPEVSILSPVPLSMESDARGYADLEAVAAHYQVAAFGHALAVDVDEDAYA
jgi:hypothetical protein